MQKRYQWNKNFSNGDRYNGEATGENIKDGQGEYFWAATGAVYKGSWANDLPHGEGVLSVPGSSSDTADPTTAHASFMSSSMMAKDVGYTYEGHFELGQRSGQGVCRFTSGRVYTGEWKQDEMSGQGTLTGAPGGLDNFVEYKGPFLRGRRHGPNGCCRYVNGDMYVGDWLQGKRHGQGRWELHQPSSPVRSSPPANTRPTSSSASPPPPDPLPPLSIVEYTGAFLQDVPTCKSGGAIRYVDGSTYAGGVTGLGVKRDGHGELRLASGDSYVGTFRDNQRDGEGTWKCHADASSYEGFWRGDQLDGNVVYRKPQSRERSTKSMEEDALVGGVVVVAYNGPCERNEFTGAGARVTFADQSVYQGEVREGRPEGRGVMENRRMTPRDGLPKDWFCPENAEPVNAWSVVLSRYEGNFYAGKPDGDGAGTFRFVSITSGLEFPILFTGQAAQPFQLPEGAKGLRINYHRNGVFTGKWAKGIPQGRGKWAWDDGDVCEGEMKAGGLPSGQGSYQNAQATYTGEFTNGQPHGTGAYHHLLTKESYEGHWSNGLFHGEGGYNWFDRDHTALAGSSAGSPQPSLVYRGSWQQGKMSGKGSESRICAAPSLSADPVFADAPTSYSGGYSDGLYSGQGKLTIVNGASTPAVYEGAFVNGVRTGQGKLTLSDGTVVEGLFENGQPHGSGVVASFPSEITYRGAYDHGNPCDSAGEIQYPNGDKYKGEVESANATGENTAASAFLSPLNWMPQRHGKGVFTFVEGNVLSCTWRHNVLHGEGTYKTYEGDVSTRHYVDGVIESRIQSTVGNVFTAENELPNTLSEDALKKMRTEPKKPFTFVRKGEGGGIAAANTNHSPHSKIIGEGGGTPSRKGKAPAQRTQNKTRNSSNSCHNSNHDNSVPPSAAGATAAASNRARQTADGPTTTRGLSPSPSPVPLATPRTFTGARDSRKVSGSGAALGTKAELKTAIPPRLERSPRQSNSLQSASKCKSATPPTSPRPSGAVRSKDEVRAAIARRMSSRTAGSTNSASTSKNHLSAAAVEVPIPTRRISLIEAFQEGIGKMDKTLSATTESGASTATSATRRSPGGAEADVAAATRPGGGKGVIAPRGPLKGQLRNLMDEACAIRNSKEDEIQLLTDELRVLNEKIWQLRFTMSDGGKVKGGKPPSKNEQRLAAMMEERKGTVDKLSCLLQR